MSALFSKVSSNPHNTLVVSALVFNLLSVSGSKRKKKGNMKLREWGNNVVKTKMKHRSQWSYQCLLWKLSVI